MEITLVCICLIKKVKFGKVYQALAHHVCFLHCLNVSTCSSRIIRFIETRFCHSIRNKTNRNFYDTTRQAKTKLVHQFTVFHLFMRICCNRQHLLILCQNRIPDASLQMQCTIKLIIVVFTNVIVLQQITTYIKLQI